MSAASSSDFTTPLTKNIGVLLDPDLNFESHISNLTKTAFYHLRNIAKVQPFLSQADTERLMHAFITSRLDYCNALLSGLPVTGGVWTQLQHKGHRTNGQSSTVYCTSIDRQTVQKHRGRWLGRRGR